MHEKGTHEQRETRAKYKTLKVKVALTLKSVREVFPIQNEQPIECMRAFNVVVMLHYSCNYDCVKNVT